MKINSKVLSIPPYISTNWENVTSLTVEKNSDLVIYLKDGSKISIPNLSGKSIEEVFTAHTEYLEEKSTSSSGPKKFGISLGGFPVDINKEQLDMLSKAMQHDLSQKDAPDLPQDVIEKVRNLSNSLGLDQNSNLLPPPEPHCNCPYCQIARAIHQEHHEIEEENLEVSDEDLTFREWDIDQVGEQLYTVSHPLDKKESYQVYLGKPLGCTCGHNNCEHIKAVLNS